MGVINNACEGPIGVIFRYEKFLGINKNTKVMTKEWQFPKLLTDSLARK